MKFILSTKVGRAALHPPQYCYGGRPCAPQSNSAMMAGRRPTQPAFRNSWSALLFFTAALTTGSLLICCPVSAHAQSGVPLWTNRYDNGNDQATAIAVDSSGSVFVTGYSSDSNFVNSDYA